MAKQSTTTDAVKILHRHFVEGNPKMLALLEKERTNARIAHAIYDLRTKLGLSQRKLAEMAGTTASVICRLEDADYQGHSTRILLRIAAACGHKMEFDVRFVPLPSEKRQRRKRTRQPA